MDHCVKAQIEELLQGTRLLNREGFPYVCRFWPPWKYGSHGNKHQAGVPCLNHSVFRRRALKRLFLRKEDRPKLYENSYDWRYD